MLRWAFCSQEVIAVEKKNKSVAVVADPEYAQQLEAERQQKWDRGWRAIDRIRERNADNDPDEELAFITEVVEEVRQERYDAAQRKVEGHR